MCKDAQMKFLLLLIFISYFLSVSAIAGKKVCQPYLDKLRNIQSQQRAGYSGKQGRKLADREQKARGKWWACQQGKLPKKKKSKKKKTAKTKERTVVSYSSKTSSKKVTQPLTNKLVLRAKYRGIQQQAWLDYYQKPKKCIRPKTTKIFAYCIEHEKEQQLKFERSDYFIQANN